MDLEHGVVVLRRIGNDLQHVPVLDDLSGIVESEDVDASVIVIARPGLVAMQNNEIALCDHPFELNALAGVVRGHALEVLDERLLSVAHSRVVLRVGVADIGFNGFSRPAPIEHQVVKGRCVRLVLGMVVGHHSLLFRLPEGLPTQRSVRDAFA